MEEAPLYTQEFSAAKVYNSYGVNIGIRTNEPSIFNHLSGFFPPDTEERSDSPVDTWYCVKANFLPSNNKILYQIYQDEEKLREGYGLKRVLNFLDSKIRLRIGQASKDKLFVHAGVVGWKNRAIIIPGRSGTGKTTLVAALIEAGASYYSDEYAVLDTLGYTHPYARPLSFRQGFGRRIRLCSVSDFGGRQGSEPLRVGLVVHTRYSAESKWEPFETTPGQATLALLGNALAVRDRPAFSLSVLSRAVAGARLLEGDRGDAKPAALAILDYVKNMDIS